ncbi:MAG TPA: hypothetical protein VF174_14185 [Micromonosporaceae bacterium]
MSAVELTRTVELLVRQVGHWHEPRWAAPPSEPGTATDPSLIGATRGDVVHRLVQAIADLAADAEGEPRRVVPRLDSDLALPDQLRVVAADLVAADPPDDVLVEAAALVSAARRML